MLDDKNYIGYEIAKVHKAMRAKFHGLLKPYDITVQQFEILRILEKRQRITAAQLVADLVSDSSTVMSILKRLETKGLIIRNPDEKDRRSKLISLTRQGQNTLHALQDRAMAYNQKVAACCTAEELELFTKVLKRFYEFSQGEFQREEP